MADHSLAVAYEALLAVGRAVDARHPSSAERAPRTEADPYAEAQLDEIHLSPAQSSDELLLAGVREGNGRYLSALFRRHAGKVFGVAHRILRDRAESEEVLQEVFLFVSQRSHLFDPKKGSAISWLLQVAYHRSIDRRRQLSARKHYDLEQLEESVTGSVGQPNYVDQLTASALLQQGRSELSPDQLKTLELHFFEGYTLREIAERTGQSLGNVRNHLYRGLERLRSLVAAQQQGTGKRRR